MATWLVSCTSHVRARARHQSCCHTLPFSELPLGLGTEIRFRDRTDKDETVPGYPKIILTFGSAYRFLDAPVTKKRRAIPSKKATLHYVHFTGQALHRLHYERRTHWETALVSNTHTSAHTIGAGDTCVTTQSTTTAMLAKLAAHPPVCGALPSHREMWDGVETFITTWHSSETATVLADSRVSLCLG